jgi:hypothetical protein
MVGAHEIVILVGVYPDLVAVELRDRPLVYLPFD